MVDLYIDSSLDDHPIAVDAIRRAHDEFAGRVKTYSPAIEKWSLSKAENSDPVIHLEVDEEGFNSFGEYPLINAERFPRGVFQFLLHVWGKLLKDRTHRILENIQAESRVGSLG